MKRVVTAVIGMPLSLAAVFLLPAWGFFLLVAVLVELAAAEYVQLNRVWAPRAPLRALLVMAPLAALALGTGVGSSFSPAASWGLLLAVAALASVGVGALVLLARTPLEEAVAAIGALSFGIPYFALPIASLYLLQRQDPWLVLLLLLIVWLGDTAAFCCGSALGRHKMAPMVSPNKTWEGAAAGFAAALIATMVWSYWRLGTLDLSLLALGGVTGMAAQMGDLVESLIKRKAGVKDSGNLLPGHGGFLDRLDALLFGAPVFLIGLQWLGPAILSR